MAEVDLKRLYEKSKRNVQTMRESLFFNINEYMLKDRDERFRDIMLLYEKICPNWKQVHKKVESRKPKEIRENLQVKNMEELIDDTIGTDLIEMAITMQVSNRIAHESMITMDNLFRCFINDQVEKGKIDYTIYDKNLNKIYRLLDSYSDLDVKRNNSYFRKITYKLNQEGLNNEVLKEFESEIGDDVRQASEMASNAFYIKDFEIDNIIEYLQENKEDISYGKCTFQSKDSNGENIFEKDGSPKMEHVFIIDLPYYGQFSVHLKAPGSISALSDTPYNMLHFYEKETVIMTSEISNAAQNYIDRRCGKNKNISFEDILPDLQKLKNSNPRFAHYIALKMGATKGDLDNLYSDETER